MHTFKETFSCYKIKLKIKTICLYFCTFVMTSECIKNESKENFLFSFPSNSVSSFTPCIRGHINGRLIFSFRVRNFKFNFHLDKSSLILSPHLVFFALAFSKYHFWLILGWTFKSHFNLKIFVFTTNKSRKMQ